MRVLRRSGRRTVAVLVMLPLSLGITAVWQGAVGTENESTGPFGDGIVVVGDSITALYNDDAGHEDQGWWSMVGHRFDAEVRTFAQSGSGYQRPGRACQGNRFIDRAEALEGPAPSVFIVEGGRNDWATCREGSFVISTDQAVQDGVDTYLREVRAALPSTTRIVVLSPPWGPMDPWQKRRITSIVHTSALRQGLEYVSAADTLASPDRVVDGVHPNRAGNRAIADVVVAALSAPPP